MDPSDYHNRNGTWTLVTHITGTTAVALRGTLVPTITGTTASWGSPAVFLFAANGSRCLINRVTLDCYPLGCYLFSGNGNSYIN